MKGLITYYARMDYDPRSGRTAKYTITAEAGVYPPMEVLKGRDGKVSMYLMEKPAASAENAPSVRLQAKNSLNFTGLKEYFVGGKVSGYAYGYPLADETYSAKRYKNPFYEYKNDGFLFIVHTEKIDNAMTRVPTIELIVIDGGKVLISSYCKALMMHGYDEELGLLRELAKRADKI